MDSSDHMVLGGLLLKHATTTKVHTPKTCAVTREASAMRSPLTTIREEPPLTETKESLGIATKT